MHALRLLSLRSLPLEFKMSPSASLSATSLVGIGQAPSLIARSDPEPIGIAPFLLKLGFFDREMHALRLLSLRSLPLEFKMSPSASLSATSLVGIGQAPSLIARSDPEPIGIAPFLLKLVFLDILQNQST
ncbi:unnamed protein product [Ilex paraguariensis]|uniref:Uncharacterized protein n=1 Tax=Ilex paraguariensis TaxID=185542 RepID=A0ABC8SCK3_9AQUA